MKVVFSPHIDDSFLSLGGSILNWKKKGEEVYIINIFSISNYTKHGVADPEKTTKQRKEEEINIQELTGVDVSFLNFPEPLLRGYEMKKEEPFYPDEIDERIDEGLLEAIERESLKYIEKSAHCYFPLAIGNHVDHLLIRNLGEAFTKNESIKQVSFYEDVPYVGWYKTPDEFIKKMDLSPYTEEIDVEKKIEIVKNYRSQIKKEWIDIIQKHALFLSEKGSERVWSK